MKQRSELYVLPKKNFTLTVQIAQGRVNFVSWQSLLMELIYMNTENVNSESAIDDNCSFIKSFLFSSEINFELLKCILTAIRFIDIVGGCRGQNVLVTTSRCWWRFWQFRSQHPLSFYITVGHQHSKDTTNAVILSPTSKNLHQL